MAWPYSNSCPDHLSLYSNQSFPSENHTARCLHFIPRGIQRVQYYSFFSVRIFTSSFLRWNYCSQYSMQWMSLLSIVIVVLRIKLIQDMLVVAVCRDVSAVTYFYGRTSSGVVQTANPNNPAGVLKSKYNSPRPLNDFNYVL
jgi:hypothetical protein